MTGVDARGVEEVDIYRNDILVGHLRRASEGGSVFEQERAFFDAHRELPGGLATQLPYSQRLIETRGVNLHPYFAGLLPEGMRLRALIARSKTSEDDLFTLLVAAGPDCVGDLFPVPRGSDLAPLDRSPETAGALDQLSFAELFARSIDSATEPAIPGVQEKLSPSVISFPVATRGKRWILKLNPPDKELLVENEHFFMGLAADCGLDVPRVHLVRDRVKAAGLLIERFDRRRDGRRWVGVHQEDACQFLNKYPADKYRLNVGDIARGMASWCDAPAVECARLIDLVAFSYLIGNGDLHAKNVSLSAAHGGLQLSPAYDLLSTRPYRDLKMALKLEGRDDNLKRRDFVELGRRFGVAQRAVENRLDALVERATPLFPRVKEIGFEARITRQLGELMKKRAADLRG